MKYWTDNDFQEATLARILFALCIVICFLSCKTLTPAEKARREYIKTVAPHQPVTVEPVRKKI